MHPSFWGNTGLAVWTLAVCRCLVKDHYRRCCCCELISFPSNCWLPFGFSRWFPAFPTVTSNGLGEAAALCCAGTESNHKANRVFQLRKMGNIRPDQMLWCSVPIPSQQKQRNDLWCTLSTLALNGSGWWTQTSREQLEPKSKCFDSQVYRVYRSPVPCINKRLVFFPPPL